MSTENDSGSQNTSQETLVPPSQNEQQSSPLDQGQSSQTTAPTEKEAGTEKTETSPAPETKAAQTVSNPLEIKPEADDAKKAEGQEGQKQEAKEDAAPESYADFKAPEGVELNSAVVDSFKGIAKKLNLSQEKAQAVIDEITPVMVSQQVEFINKVSGQWLEKTPGSAVPTLTPPSSVRLRSETDSAKAPTATMTQISQNCSRCLLGRTPALSNS